MQASSTPMNTVHAYNLAFEALGLDWRWDEAVVEGAQPGPQALRRYVERNHPHLLRAYEADFLVEAIESERRRHLAHGAR